MKTLKLRVTTNLPRVKRPSSGFSSAPKTTACSYYLRSTWCSSSYSFESLCFDFLRQGFNSKSRSLRRVKSPQLACTRQHAEEHETRDAQNGRSCIVNPLDLVQLSCLLTRTSTCLFPLLLLLALAISYT